jgi:hypothetical protein
MPPAKEHLRDLELELLQPGVRRSPQLLSNLMADEFREFGSSGRIFTKDQIIDALRTESPVQISISNFRAETIGESAALVTYQAARRDDANDRDIISLRSSLWVIRDGRWQILFHQGTRVPEVDRVG